MTTKYTEEELEKMLNVEANLAAAEKVVENQQGGVAKNKGGRPSKRTLTTGYIRPHQKGGKNYYYYVHPGGKEEYLGSAETILRKVKGDDK